MSSYDIRNVLHKIKSAIYASSRAYIQRLANAVALGTLNRNALRRRLRKIRRRGAHSPSAKPARAGTDRGSGAGSGLHWGRRHGRRGSVEETTVAGNHCARCRAADGGECPAR